MGTSGQPVRGWRRLKKKRDRLIELFHFHHPLGKAHEERHPPANPHKHRVCRLFVRRNGTEKSNLPPSPRPPQCTGGGHDEQSVGRGFRDTRDTKTDVVVLEGRAEGAPVS